MDDIDHAAWVQDALGVDPESYASSDPGAPPAAVSAPEESQPATDPQPVTDYGSGDQSGNAPVDPPAADGAPAQDQPAVDPQGQTLPADQAPANLPSDPQPQPEAPENLAASAMVPVSDPALDAGPDGGDAAVPLQADGGADAGRTDAGGDAGADAGADEVPTMRPTSPVPTDIRTDTAVDFVDQANAARGGGGEVGHMKPSISYNPDADASGKITRVNMVVETSIVRPRFAGGRPNDVNRAAIKTAEDLIKAHEERHRDIARDYATRAVKAMRGKTGPAVKKAFDDAMKQMDAAQAALDTKEGKITVRESNGGATVDVALGPT